MSSSGLYWTKCVSICSNGVRLQYPALANCAIKTLMPFATTYLCETGFSALASMKTRYRHRLCGEWLETEALSHSTQNCGVMCVKSSTSFPLIWWVVSYILLEPMCLFEISKGRVFREIINTVISFFSLFCSFWDKIGGKALNFFQEMANNI